MTGTGKSYACDKRLYIVTYGCLMAALYASGMRFVLKNCANICASILSVLIRVSAIALTFRGLANTILLTLGVNQSMRKYQLRVASTTADTGSLKVAKYWY